MEFEDYNLLVNLNTKEDAEHLQLFIDSYKIEDVLIGSVKTKKGINNIKNKICRFCQEKEPQITFSQETHIIPQLMNRAKPISYFECDNCNVLFSKYESDFGHFFLLERALFGHKKKKGGYPKLKSRHGATIQRTLDTSKLTEKFSAPEEVLNKIETDELRLINISQDIEGLDIEINEEENKMKLNITRPPYRPLNIFRVFLKIGLSLIKESELEKFKSIRKLLKADIPEFNSPEILLYKYTIPFLKNYFKDPIVYLCNKEISNSKLCDKTLIVFFGNKIYQIPMFSDDNYRCIAKSKKLEIVKISPYLNPLFIFAKIQDSELFDSLSRLKVYKWNLSSQKINKEDVETLELQI